MSIIALLAWYDEPVDLLGRCVRSLWNKVDRLVAVDGRYDMFPSEAVNSSNEQCETIREACEQMNMPLTLHQPTYTWTGEPEKRTLLFGFGFRLASRGDWFLVIDADETVRTVPRDLRRTLATTHHDVAQVTVQDMFLAAHPVPGIPIGAPSRRLFRAIPIFVRKHHSTYVTATGRVLASRRVPEHSPCLDLRGMVMNHTPHDRPAAREIAKQNYYAIRDTSGVEEVST